VRDYTWLVDEEVENGNNVSLIFGSNFLRSGKAAQVFLFAGQFFSFELSRDQAARLELKPNTVRQLIDKRYDRTDTPLLAELSTLKIDGSDVLDRSKKITGSVACRTLAKGRGQLALRLSYRGTDGYVASFHYLDKGGVDGKRKLAFSFSPIDYSRAGPLVLFLDLCTVIERHGRLPDIVRHSNTLGVLVQVVDR
jgi:hypothetical protein